MPPSRRGGPWRTEKGTDGNGLGGFVRHVPYDRSPFLCGAVYSEVCGPNYKKQGVLAPDVGGASLFGRSFVSFPLGWPMRAVEGEAPGSRPVHGSWTAPARIRGGTQGIAKPKGGSCQPQLLGRVSGLGRGRFVVRTAARAQFVGRTEPNGLPAWRQVSNIAG